MSCRAHSARPPRSRFGDDRSPVARGVLLALCSAVLASCLGGSDRPDVPRRMPVPAPTGADSLVIGLVGTFSGAGVFSGEDAFEGADLGVQVMNRRRGGDQRPFELVTLDDRGNPRRARRLVARLAASRRTVGIVYAGPPEALPGAERALARAGIPAVLCYGDLYSARRLTPHVFQTSPPFLWQARRIASYLFDDRRYVQVGALVGRSFTGSAALGALRAVLEDDGRALAAAERYSPRRGREDLRRPLQRLRRARVEAVVVEGSAGFLAGLHEVLRSMGARYRTTPAARILSAPPVQRERRLRTGWWRPQLASFDLALAPTRGRSRLAPGTVASDSYARGVHYLPVPSFKRFRDAFVDWWGARPLGLEGRAYEATRMIGWGLSGAEAGDDLARRLEGLSGARFGALDVTLGPDDHTAIEQTAVGLWVVPAPRARIRERADIPASLPWVPLARGFSIDGRRTDVDSKDWKHLFRNPPPRRAPPPSFRKMLFGVTTPRSDPLH